MYLNILVIFHSIGVHFVLSLYIFSYICEFFSLVLNPIQGLSKLVCTNGFKIIFVYSWKASFAPISRPSNVT
jgi:hypothetical protein